MPSGRKLKDFTKKIIPSFLLQHLVAFHQILFNPYNSGMRMKKLYRYLKWYFYNKPFRKIAYANLINGYRTIVYPDSDSGVSDIYLPNEYQVPRRFQWYIAEGMLSLPTAKWSMVISFFSGVMASGFAFGCAKDTVEFFNAGIGEVRFPVGEGFLLVIFDYVGPWV